MDFKPKPENERLRASITRYVSFQRLESDPHGVLLMRFMHAANDIFLANWSADKYEPRNIEQLPHMERHLAIGANQYFFRLMCGHLNEGLELIREFNNCPILVSFLDQCPIIVAKARDELNACLKSGADFQYFRRTVGRLRDKAAFHYDANMTRFAIEYLADRPIPPPAMITMGADAFLTRFNLADVVMDVALTRKVLGVPPGDDVWDRGLAPFAEFLNRKCIAFVVFVKGFIATYLN